MMHGSADPAKREMIMRALAARKEGSPLVNVDINMDEEDEEDLENSDLAPEGEPMVEDEAGEGETPDLAMGQSVEAAEEVPTGTIGMGEMEGMEGMDEAFMGGMREDELTGPPKSLRERAIQEMLKKRAQV